MVRIEITIKEDGSVEAHTEGIKGPSCVEELKKLLKDIAEVDEVDHTGEFYEVPKPESVRTPSQKKKAQKKKLNLREDSE
jgi:hypothetical protein